MLEPTLTPIPVAAADPAGAPAVPSAAPVMAFDYGPVDPVAARAATAATTYVRTPTTAVLPMAPSPVAARTATRFDPPAAHIEEAGVGAQMLDAIADALVPEEAPSTRRPASAVPGAPMPAVVAGAAAAPIAVAAPTPPAPAAALDAGTVVSETLPATRNVGYGTAAAPVAAAALAYGQTAAATIAQPVRKAASAARRKGSELWAGIKDPRRVHVTQVASRYNPSPAPGNRDCGPASVLMSIRLLGLTVPGTAADASPQRQIDRVRSMARAGASRVATTNFDLERALTRAGATVRELTDGPAVRQAVLAGRPVILNGNARNAGAYGHAFNARTLEPFDGPHWIVVSGFDTATGKFLINDPLSKAGPLKVTPAQLEAYRGGSMGIEVSR